MNGIAPNGVNSPAGSTGGAVIRQHAVGLLEPLLMGLFAPPSGKVVDDIQGKIAFLISKYVQLTLF